MNGLISLSIEVVEDLNVPSTLVVLCSSLLIVLVSWGASYCCYRYKPDLTSTDTENRGGSIPAAKGQLRSMEIKDKVDSTAVGNTAEVKDAIGKDFAGYTRRKLYYGIGLHDEDSTVEGTEKWLLVDKKIITQIRCNEPFVSNYSLMLAEESIFSKYAEKESERYFWLIILMGVFYTLPVVQLVLTHQENVISTGAEYFL